MLVFLILYFSFFIVHLSSRIGIVALYVVLLLNLVRHIRKHKSWIKGVVVLFAIHGLLAFIVLNVGVTKYRFQHIFGFEYYTGYKVNDGQHKLKLWNAAIGANENFLFGNGMGDINSALKEKFASLKSTKAITENYNSHNQYIEYYVGLGFLGFVVFTYLLLYYGYMFLKHGNFLGFQFIVITAILCLTESLWSRHHGIVFSVIFLGVILGLNNHIPTSNRPSKNF
nr:O-antigen ligase family protein [uncultured Allomuricauda sp.]